MAPDTPDAAGPDATDAAPGSGGAAADSGSSADFDAEIAVLLSEYRTWQPRTAEPRPISDYIFGLCRLPTLKEQTFAESEHGNGRWLQDWVNEEASAGIAARSTAFAVGSTIVKEKYVPDASGRTLVARGIMIKRAPGFDSAHGDWDYAYWEPDLGVLHTDEQTSYCAGCHADATTDSVYIDGLSPGW